MQKTVILTKNGEPEGISQMDQNQVNRLKGKTFQSGSDKIGVVDTNQTVSEEMIQQKDYGSLARQLGKAVVATLRDHGDEVAFVSAKGVSQSGCTIHVQYKPDDQGEVWEDDFQFGFNKEGQVTLGDDVICQVGQISGNLSIQVDLVKDALAKFIDSKESPTMSPDSQTTKITPQSNSSGIMECGDMQSFCEAVNAYRENPSRENIKTLLRRSRGFEGDDILHKFKNAVESYKQFGAVQQETPCQQHGSETSGLCLDISLFIRLMEYAREDAKEDVDLHFVAENLERVCKEKGCASMEDYEVIVQCSNVVKNKPEEESNEEVGA